MSEFSTFPPFGGVATAMVETARAITNAMPAEAVSAAKKGEVLRFFM